VLRSLRFDLEWRITALSLVLFPLFIWLGFWQLDRAEEKTRLAASFELRSQQAPAPLDRALLAGDPAGLAYLPVAVTGRFVEGRDLLLDNRIREGRFGYEVVSPVELASGEGLVLVNRGWVAGDPARLQLPEVPSVPGNVRLTGHLYVAPGEPYLLAEQELQGPWPKRLQALEMDKLVPALGAQLEAPLLPYPVRIDAGQPGALDVAWQIVNVSPAKHRGYAVQWFTMAAVLLLYFLLRNSNLWQVLRGRGNDGK
jgi:cytochrome oxidase assembly protein ShyY1